MNDFTKEELELMLEDLNNGAYESFIDVDRDKFRQKIQSMIDNYCEHESLDEFDLFLPRVGAILTEEKNRYKLSLIRNLYLKTVWPDKYRDE